jgi:hypothetical protein
VTRIEALAQDIRRIATAAEDELVSDPAERDSEALLALGGDLRTALSGLVREIRSSPERLAAAAPCHDATARAVEIWNGARATVADANKRPTTDRSRPTAIREAEAVVAALDLELDLVDLVIIDARLQVATVLRDAGVKVRSTAERAGLTPGYVSELKSMAKPKGGLPSADAAMRLDRAIGRDGGELSLQGIVTTANELSEELRAERRRRGRHSSTTMVGGKSIPTDLRTRDRVQLAAEALRRDDQLLRGVEQLISLGERERRAVIRMLDELAGHARGAST